MATESICLKLVPFPKFTKNPLDQFHERRRSLCRIHRSRFGVVCSKTSDYQDFRRYARPLRLLPAEEVKVFKGNQSLIVSQSKSLYKLKLQTSNLFGSEISDVNSRVLICLIDEKDDSILQTIPTNLDSNVSESGESLRFQRGSVDEFVFEGPKLSKIKAFWISLESGQWRIQGVILQVVNLQNQEPNCDRYEFKIDEILLGESSDLSMVELRPKRIIDYDPLDDQNPNLDSPAISKEQSMEEYTNLKLSLLLYDAILIFTGTLAISFSLGENSAIVFFLGGTFGFLYLLLLQKSVDELQAPESSSASESLEANQILSNGLKIPVLSLALAAGISGLAIRGYIGEDLIGFIVTPKEIVVGILGFVVCKVAVLLAAFKPLKDGS